MNASKSPTVYIALPIRVKNPLNNSQGFSKNATFAAARARKAERDISRLATSAALRARGVQTSALLPCVIMLVRVSPRPFDTDGLAASFKAIRDGIADALGFKTDRHPSLCWEYSQRRGRPREYGVEIAIERRGA